MKNALILVLIMLGQNLTAQVKPLGATLWSIECYCGPINDDICKTCNKIDWFSGVLLTSLEGDVKQAKYVDSWRLDNSGLVSSLEIGGVSYDASVITHVLLPDGSLDFRILESSLLAINGCVDGKLSGGDAGGTDGINCWDINENGIGDIEEDINNDGVYNTMDCQPQQENCDSVYVNSTLDSLCFRNCEGVTCSPLPDCQELEDSNDTIPYPVIDQGIYETDTSTFIVSCVGYGGSSVIGNVAATIDSIAGSGIPPDDDGDGSGGSGGPGKRLIYNPDSVNCSIVEIPKCKKGLRVISWDTTYLIDNGPSDKILVKIDSVFNGCCQFIEADTTFTVLCAPPPDPPARLCDNCSSGYLIPYRNEFEFLEAFTVLYDVNTQMLCFQHPNSLTFSYTGNDISTFVDVTINFGDGVVNTYPNALSGITGVGLTLPNAGTCSSGIYEYNVAPGTFVTVEFGIVSDNGYKYIQHWGQTIPNSDIVANGANFFGGFDARLSSHGISPVSGPCSAAADVEIEFHPSGSGPFPAMIGYNGTLSAANSNADVFGGLDSINSEDLLDGTNYFEFIADDGSSYLYVEFPAVCDD